MARQYAGRLTLIAFAAASIQGLVSGTDFEGALKSALAAGAVCYLVGLVCGELGRRVVEESARAEFARMLAESNSEA